MISDLESLKVRLAEWRKTHSAPTPLASELWRDAAIVAQRHGIGHTAKALRLEHGRLRSLVREAERPTPERSNARADVDEFFEMLLPPAREQQVDARIEVENGRAGRLRIESQKLPVSALVEMLRAFVG